MKHVFANSAGTETFEVDADSTEGAALAALNKLGWHVVGGPDNADIGRQAKTHCGITSRIYDGYGIHARVYDDHRALDVQFDCERWFAQATDEQILALAKIEWGGDEAADCVAEFFSSIKPVSHVFDYIRGRRRDRDAPGFECHVDESHALRWLAKHRPQLAAALNDDDVVECDSCGDEVETVVGCPDGAEICEPCFGAGMR